MEFLVSTRGQEEQDANFWDSETQAVLMSPSPASILHLCVCILSFLQVAKSTEDELSITASLGHPDPRCWSPFAWSTLCYWHIQGCIRLLLPSLCARLAPG